MKKILGLILILLAVVLLAGINTGCSASAKKAYHLQKANQYFDAGQYDQAEQEYLTVLRKYDHENAQAIIRLGTIYFNEGLVQKSAPFLLKGRELATNDLDLRLKVGTYYLAAGKVKESRAEADFVLARRPKDDRAPLIMVAAADTSKALEETRVRLQGLAQKEDDAVLQVALGSIALHAKDYKAAESSFKKAQALDPKSSAAWSALGFFYLAQSNLTLAEPALKTAAELAPERSQEKLQYAEFKMQTGDVAAGKHILEMMVQKTPDYIPGWMMLVKIAVSEKKYDEAANLLEKVLTRDPDNYDAMMSSGQLKLAQGKTAEATAELERMAKIYAQSPIIHYQLAVAYLAGNATDKAIASLNQAVTLNTNYTEAILLLDGLQIKGGNADSALISLKKLIQQHPQAAQVQLLLAEAYHANGNLDAALATYRQLEAAYPTNFQISLLMGVISVEQKNYSAARNFFNRALELAPDNFKALEQLVNLDVMEQQYPIALQRVQAKLAKDPKMAELQTLQAQIFLAQGDKKQAHAALLNLVETHPDSEIGHMLLARSYMDDKQNQKALVELKTVVANNSKNENALLIMGMIYSDETNYSAARDTYEKILVINPASSPVLNNLAYIDSEYLGDLDRAYELAKKARELIPGDPSAADTLGWILCKRGQYPSAQTLLQESANQLPDEPEVQFHLGWAFYMSGQEGPAQLAFQRALKSGKEFRGKDECNECMAILAVNPKTAGSDAIARLEKKVSVQPKDSIAFTRLASIYQRNGSTDKAMSAYDSALKINPKNTSGLINLAQLYSAKKNPQKAIELVKSAYQLAPDNPQISLTLGRLAFETGDYKLSLNMLQEAANTFPGNPDVLFDFALAAYAMGQVPEAQTAASSALKASPNFSKASEATRFLSMTSLAANPSAAGSQIQEILKSEPDYVPALMVMAAANEQKNDVANAVQIYKKVLIHYPFFTPAQRHLAILCAESPDNDPQAYEFANKARAAYPDDPAVAKAFGIILYRQADYSKAERLLNESSTTSNTDPEILYYLGMAQYHLKKPVECKKNLQQALTLNLPAQFTPETKRILAELK
jgi:putative PEP-CTERM system TPR-repeat lipoprotein